jgi:hypothetical protein
MFAWIRSLREWMAKRTDEAIHAAEVRALYRRFEKRAGTADRAGRKALRLLELARIDENGRRRNQVDEEVGRLAQVVLTQGKRLDRLLNRLNRFRPFYQAQDGFVRALIACDKRITNERERRLMQAKIGLEVRFLDRIKALFQRLSQKCYDLERAIAVNLIALEAAQELQRRLAQKCSEEGAFGLRLRAEEILEGSTTA